MNNLIAPRIDELFKELNVWRESDGEFKSRVNSLPGMANIISDTRIDDQVQVALEYRIPLTSKRVDFMIGGCIDGNDNVVIVEPKQWTECTAIPRLRA
ncbi:MAG: hypothetical protein ILO53_03940 [Clostridia bacterium]|nr:hypothetical protein [Clostridia bacterium]